MKVGRWYPDGPEWEGAVGRAVSRRRTGTKQRGTGFLPGCFGDVDTRQLVFQGLRQRRVTYARPALLIACDPDTGWLVFCLPRARRGNRKYRDFDNSDPPRGRCSNSRKCAPPRASRTPLFINPFCYALPGEIFGKRDRAVAKATVYVKKRAGNSRSKKLQSFVPRFRESLFRVNLLFLHARGI